MPNSHLTHRSVDTPEYCRVFDDSMQAPYTALPESFGDRHFVLSGVNAMGRKLSTGAKGVVEKHLIQENENC